jgi:hypothetical protein
LNRLYYVINEFLETPLRFDIRRRRGPPDFEAFLVGLGDRSTYDIVVARTAFEYFAFQRPGQKYPILGDDSLEFIGYVGEDMEVIVIDLAKQLGLPVRRVDDFPVIRIVITVRDVVVLLSENREAFRENSGESAVRK